jgi:hypothetical protein
MSTGNPVVATASTSTKDRGALAYPACMPEQAVLISHSDGSGTWPGIREVHGGYIPGPSARDVKSPADPAPGPEAPAQRYRTSSPVATRPISIRWISDVPSKIV